MVDNVVTLDALVNDNVKIRSEDILNQIAEEYKDRMVSIAVVLEYDDGGVERLDVFGSGSTAESVMLLEQGKHLLVKFSLGD